jgi:hypothetical protein
LSVKFIKLQGRKALEEIKSGAYAFDLYNAFKEQSRRISLGRILTVPMVARNSARCFLLILERIDFPMLFLASEQANALQKLKKKQ